MYQFDQKATRAGSDSVKWAAIAEDVIPMWVADMDFQSPPAITEALLERATHPYYGYPVGLDKVKEMIRAHYEKKYGVEIKTEWIVFCPSVIPGVVMSMKMMGGKFMYSVPMYDHIRRLYDECDMTVIEVPMHRDENYRYTQDFEALEAAVTPEVKSMILCNPHNPLGRVYTREELLEVTAFCKKHNLLVICDEIHCELDLEDRHIPFFSISEDAANYSVTLSSAGKICNIPGLPMGFAIIPNEELRKKFMKEQDSLEPSGNVMSMAAYRKAYDGSCEEWKQELRAYLRGNRDLAEARIKEIPALHSTHNEGTYLLWVDCSALPVENASVFFEETARVKVGDGEIYGDSKFIRFNYGCPREQLVEALNRMEQAVKNLLNA